MQLVLELGGYSGYSAVRMAASLTGEGVKVYSVEPNGQHQNVMQQIIQHAGVESMVEIVPGTLQTHYHVSSVALFHTELDTLGHTFTSLQLFTGVAGSTF